MKVSHYTTLEIHNLTHLTNTLLWAQKNKPEAKVVIDTIDEYSENVEYRVRLSWSTEE